MEHRGRQLSFGTSVGENCGNREERGGAHPSQSSGRGAPAHPNRHRRRRVRQAVGREIGRGRRILRRTELDSWGHCGRTPSQARQAGEEVGVPVGTVFVIFQMVVVRGEAFLLPLYLRVVFCDLAEAFERLVVRTSSDPTGNRERA